MPRIIFSAILYILFGNLVLAQEPGFSIGISGDYGLGVLKSSFGTNGTSKSVNGSIVESDAKPYMASLGKGYGFQLSISRRAKKNKEVGLSTNYHFGAPIILNSTNSNDYYYNGNSSSLTTKVTVTYKDISQVQFNPFFKISSVDSMVKPYVKMGFLVGCFGKTKIESNGTEIYRYTLSGPPPNDTTVISSIHTLTNYKGGISFGFSGAIGVDFKIADNLLFFTECDFDFMQWKPNKIKDSGSAVYNPIDDSYHTFWAYSSCKFRIGAIYIF